MQIIAKQTIQSGSSLANHEIIKLLLQNRNVEKLDEFLNPPSPLDFSLKDFGYDKEIAHAMKLLEEVKKNDQTVVVYTDYDADGITGGSVLWETLHLLGFKVMPYVPHRQHEGYGFSIKGIDRIKEQFNPSLIISVDHGITAVDQIAYAKSIGIPVIVTDHHHKQERIPETAEAIFHIPALSGSGVSYFFSKEVFNHFKGNGKFDKLLEFNFRNDYLSLASIGTIADLVPLVGPSRSVVTHGLRAFPRIKRIGLKHLCREAGIEGRTITPYEVGFSIAPRINAIGRLEHAIDALRLLCTTSEERAHALASKVGITNTERQDLVKISVEQALEQVETLRVDGTLPNILILHSPEWHEGIIGLIASKILEQYYRPVIVMAEGEDMLKGSARSIYAFHITEFFAELKEYFINYGGHRQAAGFSIKKEKLSDFITTAVTKAEEQIKPEDLERVIEVDLEIPFSQLTLSLAKEIEKLSPFGIGNPQPSFVSDLEIVSAELFGKQSDHLKVLVKDPEHINPPMEFIKFSAADDFTKLSRGKVMKIAYQLDINRWNGRETLRGRIIEIIT